jgi:hypothetical protein
MKKLLLLILPMLVLFVACDEDNGPLGPDDNKGNLFISSDPSGAAIYINGVNTNKTTPDTVEVDEGVVDVELKLNGYTDYTTQISVSAGQTSVLGPVQLVSFGSIVITSDPPGAAIILDGQNTGFGTPATISSLVAGDYEIKLQLANHEEFTQVVTVSDGVQFPLNADLTPVYSTFTSVRIWETTGTAANQPSGLDLSTGATYGISTSDRDNVDIYYYSASDGSSFLVNSASKHSNMTRETFFNNGGSSNLNDGLDSPEKTNNWALEMGDRETNYFFLYDDDGHYTKLKISSFGGGSGPGDPAWVQLDYIYNTANESRKF